MQKKKPAVELESCGNLRFVPQLLGIWNKTGQRIVFMCYDVNSGQSSAQITN